LAISNKLGDFVGKVLQLGVQVEVEILDLDAVSSTDEVLEVIRAAIPEQDDSTVKAEWDAICDVRIWPTHSEQQIATAKMSRHAATRITRIVVWWTMSHIHPKTHLPERCFRCQIFGHNSRRCAACWRCGQIRHVMKERNEVDDKCLACEMTGLPKSVPTESWLRDRRPLR